MTNNPAVSAPTPTPGTTPYQTRSLQDAIGTLRSSAGECVVLMGAGCSYTAGIPLANGLINEIRNKHPEHYERAERQCSSPSYNQVMEELSPNERQTLLNKHIQNAGINWAHLALAQMLLHNKINRVLTVNFDPLLIQACSMANYHPPVYDLAVTDSFKPHRIAPNAIFFLNGQHTGFVTLNAGDELEPHRQKLQAIVQDTGVRRVWLVVGYSGEADPLLDVLAKTPCFDGDLYWLGHDSQPSAHLLQSGLFDRGKHAFYVGGQDANKSLTTLAQQLDCFPPEILTSPFEHIQKTVQKIKFETGGDAAQGIQESLLLRLQKASENERSAALKQVDQWLLNGEAEKAQEWFEKLDSPNQEEKNLGVLAYVTQGLQFANEAKALADSGKLQAAQAKWSEAAAKYEQALAIKSDMHEAANNWGNALDDEAQALAGSGDLQAAQAKWAEAAAKYQLALAIKPDMHDAANNWGLALASEAQALVSRDLPAQAKWSEAAAKYQQALAIKPKMHEAASNWGAALAKEAQALQKDGQKEQSQTVLAQAQGVLEKQVKAFPQSAGALAYNLACVYGMQGLATLCVAQLEVSRTAGKLPGRQHLEQDGDLDAVRNAPEFQAWWLAHFPTP